MRYLESAPMVFGQYNATKKVERVVVKGGPATVIPKKYKCASGKHDKRLTQCWC